MNKYLLRFSKHGYMRFLSHLDLGRLFRRAIKKADIDVLYSNGFNPHEKINICQPLSLGFESESEYFEISTGREYDEQELIGLLNASMPEDIRFYQCRSFDASINNLSNRTVSALYRVCCKGSREEYDRLDTDAFLAQDDIKVMKRDKKTKTMVEKSVKEYIYSVKKTGCEDGRYYLDLSVRCASNESLNPVNLLNSLYAFCGMEYSFEDSLIDRIDIMTTSPGGEPVPLFDFDKL